MGERRLRTGDGRVASVERAGPEQQDGWRRPWLPWAVGLGLLLLGAAVGWGSSYLALSPVLGQPGSNPRPALKGVGESAQVEVTESLTGTEPPGTQLTLTWHLRNTGGTTWAADTYRFAPHDARTPVIPLPHALPPGESVTIQATVSVPDIAGIWQPGWQLTGERGSVPGGTLTTSIAVGDQPISSGDGQENPADNGKR